MGLEADEPEVVELVDQAVAGDAAAFGALYDRFVAPVYRYFYYRTREQSEAEDLTEQVFLKAWQAIGKFRWHGRPFLAWLYRLAHNTHTDHVRRRRPTVPLDREQYRPASAEQEAASELMQTLDADLLRRAMGRLTPEQRQVIILRFAEGLDTSQIARVLDEQEPAIRGLQMRALQWLRQALDAEGEAKAR